MKQFFRFLIPLLTLIFATSMIYTQEEQEAVLFALNDGLKDDSFLTELEKQIVIETNLARTNPMEYAKKLKKLKTYYVGKYLKIPGEITLATREGVSAVDEAIDFLESATPIDPVKASKGMSQGAKDHVEDQGPSGKTGHTGEDGSSPFDRINRHGKWLKTAGENISYGSKTAERIIMQLIIDDGVSSRGHRTNIFNNDFKVMGIGFGSHKVYRNMCVQTFAGGYKEKK